MLFKFMNPIIVLLAIMVLKSTIALEAPAYIQDLITKSETDLLVEKYVEKYEVYLDVVQPMQLVLPKSSVRTNWGELSITHPSVFTLAIVTSKPILLRKILEIIASKEKDIEFDDINYYTFGQADVGDGYTPTKWHETQWTNIKMKFELKGLPPMALAVVAGCHECIPILHEFGQQSRVCDIAERMYDPVRLAVELIHLPSFRELIKLPDVPLLPHQRRYVDTQASLLHMAALAGNYPVVKYLLKKGFPPNGVVDEVLDDPIRRKSEYDDLDSPLMSAAQKGHLEIVKILVKYGADINHVNKRDTHSAYTLAVHWKHAPVARYLRRRLKKLNIQLPSQPDVLNNEMDLINSKYHEKSFIKEAEEKKVKPKDLYKEAIEERRQKGLFTPYEDQEQDGAQINFDTLTRDNMTDFQRHLDDQNTLALLKEQEQEKQQEQEEEILTRSEEHDEL